MESKDTIGNIIIGSNSTNDMILLMIFLIVFIGILLKPTKKKAEENNLVLNPSATKKNVNTVDKEIKVDLPKETSKNESTGNKTTKVDLPKYVSKPESIKAKDIVETKQPIIPTIRIPETVVETPPLVEPQEEEQTKEKYIGYNPINLFAQTEPLHFPYVIMPKPKCVIKFPRKGKTGRKGFKEEAFKKYIEEYFRNSHQVYDDRFVLVQNSSKPYEPDFALINESNGINFFLDVEIDEPYEGTNDILNRKLTHYQCADINRNNAFKNRGWIVIRFAEIQVHQTPDGCCKFIADVIKSIDSNYKVPEKLLSINTVQFIPQWTEEQSKKWSLEKYREHYLGIERFGITSDDKVLVDIEETELGEAIEEKVVDDEIETTNVTSENLSSFHKIFMAASTGKFVSFLIKNKKVVFKPINVNDSQVTGYCYIKNEVKTYLISEIENIEIKNNYYTIRVAGPTIGLDKISNIVNTAIEYKKYIRMKYTRATWNNMLVDIETGELIIDRIQAEESIRTINDVQLSINSLSEEHIQAYRLNSNYLTAYCNKREEQRTFRFDRIGEIEVLDI
ncbi:hypothetical protein AB9T89_06675 [Flavobacterium oncorhynchi]